MSKPHDDATSLQWVRNAVIAACRTARSRTMVDDLIAEVMTRLLVARRDGKKFINLGFLVRWVMADYWRKEALWYERHVQIDPLLAELQCRFRVIRIPTVEPIDGVVMDMKRVVEQLPDDSKALVFSRARSHRGSKGERLSRLRRTLKETLEAA